MSEAKNVLLSDEDLLRTAGEIGRKRGNKTLAKTVKDLLREKIAEIQVKGDPHARAERSSEPATSAA